MNIVQHTSGPSERRAERSAERLRQQVARGRQSGARRLGNAIEPAEGPQDGVPRITAEQLVGPLPRQQHLGAVLASEAADEITGDRGRIGDRLIQVIDDLRQERGDLRTNFDFVKVETERRGKSPRVRRVVVGPVEPVRFCRIGDGIAAEASLGA